MWSWLPLACKEMRIEMVSIYWILFPLVVVIAICIEMLKQQPDIKGILTRSLISVILLLTFQLIFDSIADLGDSVSERIRRSADIWKFLGELQEKTMNLNFEWLNLKSGVIFVINILSYFIAYLGFFFTNAIIHFMWAILYILSPLMILVFVFRETMGITKSLYSSLLKVISWKILYTILSVLLIRFIQVDNLHFGDDNFITTIVINLCVGISMLFVPLFANSLFGNGLSSFTSGLAMATTYPIATAVKGYAAAKTGQLSNVASSAVTRAIKDPSMYAYNKVKGHFNEKKERNREISYTGGLVHHSKPKENNVERKS